MKDLAEARLENDCARLRPIAFTDGTALADITFDADIWRCFVQRIEEKLRICPEVGEPNGEAACNAIERHIADLNGTSRPGERGGRLLIVDEPFSTRNINQSAGPFWPDLRMKAPKRRGD